MLAVVIDPAVCHSSYWWLFPECYGIAVCAGIALGWALLSAVLRKRVRA